MGMHASFSPDYGVVDDGPIVNVDAAWSIVPLTMTSTWVAVAVALVKVHPQPVPDLATRRNSSVRVNVRPGTLPRLGGSVNVTVRLPPSGQGIVRVVQGIQMGLVGDPTVYISVQVPAGCVAWAG